MNCCAGVCFAFVLKSGSCVAEAETHTTSQYWDYKALPYPDLPVLCKTSPKAFGGGGERYVNNCSLLCVLDKSPGQ